MTLRLRFGLKEFEPLSFPIANWQGGAVKPLSFKFSRYRKEFKNAPQKVGLSKKSNSNQIRCTASK